MVRCTKFRINTLDPNKIESTLDGRDVSVVELYECTCGSKPVQIELHIHGNVFFFCSSECLSKDIHDRIAFFGSMGDPYEIVDPEGLFMKTIP